jgi:uncharacterized Zn-binding protein involved in type VI secretion
MPRIARLGDPGTHPGHISTAAIRTWAENKKIARIGDTFACEIHGDNPITTGCIRTWAENKKIAFHGSNTACGARIIATAIRTWAEGNDPPPFT